MQYSQNPNQHVLQYQGRYYPLNKPQILIGSDQSCDIRIENNPHVLPIHAQIISHAGQIVIQLMERNAAIWVNGAPVSQQILGDQDEIALGDGNTRLTLLLNKNPTAGNLPATWINTPPSGNTQNTSRTHSLGPSQSQTTGRHPISSRQMPPPPAAYPQANANPALGASQQMSAFANPPQLQTPMYNNSATETTRYLCAAGHLDEGFQDYVMRNVIYEEHRSLGESYGVDMVAVVSWCKSGIRRINIRDGILTSFFGLIILYYFFSINGLAGSTKNIPSTPYGYLFPGLPTLLIGLLIFFLIVNLATSIIVLIIGINVEKWIKRRWPDSHPGIISYFLLLITSGLLGLILIPLIWLTLFIELLMRYYGEPTKHLQRNTFNIQARPAPLEPALVNKLQENFTTRQRNVVAYSGYKPFAGAGYYKDGWSFVIDTSKGAYDISNLASPATRKKPLPFTLENLYDTIESDVRALGVKNVVEIEGKLYVHGQYLPEKPDFFNSTALRPVTNVTPELVKKYKNHPTEDVRYYQCLRFNFWHGEMIFTAFLRFIQQGKDLFTEIDYLLLPPMKPDYYWVDKRESTPLLSEIWQLYKRSLDNPIQMWLGAPVRLFRSYFYTDQQRKLANAAFNNPAFDYGARTSLRQEASDDTYHLFFQELDERMYLKIIEKQILETIDGFLEAHQIDTTELRQRQQMILNNNTTNNNTNVNGPITNSGMMGIGTGAQINNHATPPSQP